MSDSEEEGFFFFFFLQLVVLFKKEEREIWVWELFHKQEEKRSIQ